MNIVTANALKKIYGSGTNIVKALDHVTLEIEHGEFVTIIGTSGSGKSTLARCLLQLLPLDQGEVWFQGEDLATLSASAFPPALSKRCWRLTVSGKGRAFGD